MEREIVESPLDRCCQIFVSDGIPGELDDLGQPHAFLVRLLDLYGREHPKAPLSGVQRVVHLMFGRGQYGEDVRVGVAGGTIAVTIA